MASSGRREWMDPERMVEGTGGLGNWEACRPGLGEEAAEVIREGVSGT